MDPALKTKLDTLKNYLSNLPDTLPLPKAGLATYNFGIRLFDISAEEIDDYGEVGAINRRLEISFGTRRDGPIIFTERGPELVGVVEVLNAYLLKEPTSAILQKWVDDLTISAELSFATSGNSLPSLPKITPETAPVGNIPCPAQVHAPGEVSDRSGRSTHRVQKLDSKTLDNSHDSDYEDLPESEDSRKSGAKLLPLLLQVSKHCRLKTNLLVDRARCIGSKGCHTSWKWPRYRQRILEHASKCGYIDAQLREAAEDELNKKAIGPPAIVPGTPAAASNPRPVPALVTQPVGPSGGKNVLKGFQTEGEKVLQDKGDYAVMKVYVCCGIPPSIVDADEFKDMMSILNPAYRPPSSSTLEDKLIVNEAAKISHATRTHLQTCRNLTITFDGGKIRKPTSVYTIHVTTADRRAFCMELDDASLLSHSADYILEALERAPGHQQNWAMELRSDVLRQHRKYPEGATLSQVLGMKIFAAVPISMTDERTMSMITWLNSARRNRQDIETLQDHIKIRQWHRAGPGAKDENIKHKPMLKWREVESTLGKRANSQLVDKSLPPAGRAAPRPRLEHSDSELGSGACASKAAPWRVVDAEIDDGNDWLDEPRQLDPAAVDVERHTFTLGGRDDIDLSSSYLRDILSDTDIFQTHAETASTSRDDPALASGSSSASKPPPASTDWDSWE